MIPFLTTVCESTHISKQKFNSKNFKEVLALRIVQVQCRHLGVRASLRVDPKYPVCLPLLPALTENYVFSDPHGKF